MREVKEYRSKVQRKVLGESWTMLSCEKRYQV